MGPVKITRSKCEWKVKVGQQHCTDRVLKPGSAELIFRRLGQDCDVASYRPSAISGNVICFTFGELLFCNPGRYSARLEVDCCPCDTFEFQVGDHCVTMSQEVTKPFFKKGADVPSDLQCQPHPPCRQCHSDPCACHAGPKNCREFVRCTGIGSLRKPDHACAC